MDVSKIVEILKMIAVLGSAILIGNWFLSELKKSRAKGEPWYKPYFTLPGLLILLAALILPIIIWIIKN